MPINYLFVLDLQATCFPSWWVDEWFPEIIEMSAIFLNLKTGEICGEFHSFVQPKYFPNLSERCRYHLNVQQKLIDNSPSLHDVLNKFMDWIDQKCDEKQLYVPDSPELYQNIPYSMICTWCHWDIASFLHDECILNDFLLPDKLSVWIETQKVLKATYPNIPVQVDLDDAMDVLEIPRIVESNNGLDEVKTLGRLIYHLKQSGANFANY